MKIKTEAAAPYAVNKAIPNGDDLIKSALEHIQQVLNSRDLYPNIEHFTNPDIVKAFLTMRLALEEREHFEVLFLNNQHKLINVIRLFSGTIDGASVPPREVVKSALLQNAAAVIFVHNHPSGVCEPSTADKTLTSTLKQALGLVDIRVLDHIIVGGLDTYSFAEHGLI